MNVPNFATLQPSSSERRLARTVAVALVCAAGIGLAVHVSTPEIRAILVVIVGALLATELLSSYVFFNQFTETRQLPLLFAACAYLTTGAVVVPYMLTFPNLWAKGVLLGGGAQSAISLWIVWHVTFPALILAYAFAHLFRPAIDRNVRAIAANASRACIVFAGIVGFVCTRYSAALPVFLTNERHFTALTTFVALPVILAVDVATIIALLAITRLRSQTQLWLAIAVLASSLDAFLGVTSDRYAVGWYVGKSLAIVSSTTLLIVFLGTMTRLYRSLRRMYFSLERVREREAAAAAAEQRALVEIAANEARRGLPLGTWEYQPRTGKRVWSKTLFSLLEIPPHANPGRAEYVERVHPDDRERYLRIVESSFKEHEPFEVLHRVVRRDGTERWMEVRADCALDDHNEKKWFGTVADVNDRIEAEHRVAQIAYRDETTNLPNRAAMRTAVSEFLGTHNAEGATMIALLFLDIDRFKIVNDVFGHPTGDALLRAIGGRLQDSLPEAFVARSGGDEFVIAIPEATSMEAVHAIAKRVLRVASQPVMIAGREFQTTTSIGISLFPVDAQTVDDLICNADIAMYRAKGSGGNTACLFSPEMRDSQIDRLALEADIRSAVIADDFELHFQPLLSLRTSEICGAEALLRWTHPVRGSVSPALVVEVAESAGLMSRVGDWVLRKGIEQRERWRHIHPEVRIAINISMGQLQSDSFDMRLLAMLQSTHVTPIEIELEITETVAMEGEAAVAEQMRRCHERGIRFSLDDFGTHYSSLTYLQRLPVETVKIDRSFVHELPGNAKDAAIVKAVIELAHSLGRVVVAEGVESAAQMQWLTEAGCDIAQGYFVGKPMPADEFEYWLLRRKMSVDVA